MKEVVWTNHAKSKMRFYRLSESRVKSVLNSPRRIEEGIAENTIAVMQAAGSKKHPYEVWVMIAEEKNRRRIISAWRYPGITKPGDPLPPEIAKELQDIRYGYTR